MKNSFFVLSILFFSCHIITTWNDLRKGDGEISWDLNRENIYKIVEGKTTEEEINILFGVQYRRKLSFDPPLLKQYRKRKYEITRILLYANPTVENEKGAHYIGSLTKENFQLTIFLKDGVVQFFFVLHTGDTGNGVWRPLKYDKYPRVTNLQDKGFDGFDWPDVECDYQFYERKVKKIWLQDNWRKIQTMTDDKCDWETEEEWEEKVRRQRGGKPIPDIVYWSRKEKERTRRKDFE